MGVSTLRAILAKAAMTEQGQFHLPDFLSCEDAGQYQIQDRGAVIQAAGGYPEERDLPQIGDQKHGARKDGCTIVELCGPGVADPLTGHVVRGKGQTGNFRSQCIDLFCEDGCKAVLDESMIDFITGNYQSGPCLSQWPNLNDGTVLTSN